MTTQGEPDPLQGVEVRNEFSAVTLTLRPYGRGTRLRIRSTLFDTVSVLDATILEALSRMDRATLVGLVSLALNQWDERAYPADFAAVSPARTEETGEPTTSPDVTRRFLHK